MVLMPNNRRIVCHSHCNRLPHLPEAFALAAAATGAGTTAAVAVAAPAPVPSFDRANARHR